LGQGLLAPNHFRSILLRAKPGVKIFVLLGACHSGDILKLDFKWNETKSGWEKRKGRSGRDQPTILCLAPCTEDELATASVGGLDMQCRYRRNGKVRPNREQINNVYACHLAKAFLTPSIFRENKPFSGQWKSLVTSRKRKRRNTKHDTPVLSSNTQLDLDSFSILEYLTGKANLKEVKAGSVVSAGKKGQPKHNPRKKPLDCGTSYWWWVIATLVVSLVMASLVYLQYSDGLFCDCSDCFDDSDESDESDEEDIVEISLPSPKRLRAKSRKSSAALEFARKHKQRKRRKQRSGENMV